MAKIILRSVDYKVIATKNRDRANEEKLIEHFSPFSMIYEDGDDLIIHHMTNPEPLDKKG